jgi:hypothetical protein
MKKVIDKDETKWYPLEVVAKNDKNNEPLKN